ncbi:hypothetical protein ACFPYI_18805 [Halomarina salina]|uniref:Uncharacterized protein n=1 Tax=Halomarina salina TaxID=1872699 RepID=A0ABD5RS13_9EURY|nr:hypothetical protein [Halomarina salina]
MPSGVGVVRIRVMGIEERVLKNLCESLDQLESEIQVLELTPEHRYDTVDCVIVGSEVSRQIARCSEITATSMILPVVAIAIETLGQSFVATSHIDKTLIATTNSGRNY